MVNEDLEAITASWKTTTLRIKLSSHEKAALEAIYKQSKRSHDITTTLHDILKGIRETTDIDFPEKSAEIVLYRLGDKGCISYWGILYKLTPKGYSIFESEHTVLSRIVTELYKIHKSIRFEWVTMPLLAAGVYLGDYGVTKHYLERLNRIQKVVDLRETQKDTNILTDYKLTDTGMRLADHLLQKASKNQV